MAVKVLFVVTNWEKLGSTGKNTGWYLPEVAHPYHVFKEKKYHIDFVSPNGGKAPMDPSSGEMFKEDPICKTFLSSEHFKELDNTKKPADINARDYQVIFFAGGHGPMYDLDNNQDMHTICKEVYENGGIVSAVCHGTVGILNTKLSNGEYLIKGQTVTGFTNAEEAAVGLTEAMPFLLETELEKNGAKFIGVDVFQPNVQISGRIITGQNPNSATPLAEAIVNKINTTQKSKS